MKQKAVLKVRVRRMKVRKLVATIAECLPWWLTSGKDIFSVSRKLLCFIEHVGGKRVNLFIQPAEGSNLFSPKERRRLMSRIAQKIRSLGLIVEERLAFGGGVYCFCHSAPS